MMKQEEKDNKGKHESQDNTRPSHLKRSSSQKNKNKKPDRDNADYRKNRRSMEEGEFMDFSDDSYVRCEDHFNRLSEDFAAERYCSRCKTAVCSSCIIDYHSSHIQDAKIKIDDFIFSQRKEVDSLEPLIFTSTHKNEILDSINKYFKSQENEFSRYLEKRKQEIDEMKNNLDKIYVLETRIINEFKEKSEGTYNEMFNSKLRDLLENSNGVSLEILKLTEAWKTMSKQEKMDLIKKNQINILKQEAKSKNNHLSLEVDIIKGNVLNLIDYVKSYRSDQAKNTMTDAIEIEINNIYITLKENFDKLQKIDIMRVAKNISIGENNIYKSSIPLRHKNDLGDCNTNCDSSNEKSYCYNKNANQNPRNKSPSNPFTFDADSDASKRSQSVPNSSIISILSENDTSNTPFSNAVANNFAYEFLIGIKPGFKNIKVFDPKAQRIFNFELSKSMFKDKSVILDDFLNNCRYVNLGFTAMITGGVVNAVLVTNSYLVIVNRNPKASIGADNSLEITAVTYSSMNDSRERHCMINLPDRYKVLVCSGFTKKSVEINNVQTGNWTTLANLSEIRANATGAYVNNRYAYIFGGFKFENGKGVYNNSAEVLDLDKELSAWKFIDFENKYSNNSIRITAAGVLNYSNEKILLCGGYNGSVYLKDVYCVEHNKDDIDVFEKTKLQLADELIFFHSAFVRCGGSAVNFDYKMDLNVYNPLTKEFKLYR